MIIALINENYIECYSILFRLITLVAIGGALLKQIDNAIEQPIGHVERGVLRTEIKDTQVSDCI